MIDTPKLTLALEGKVFIDRPIFVGEADDGQRSIVPISGGQIRGDNFSATVLPGGADWQLVKADGTWCVEAKYAIQTDDGVVIVIENKGIIVGLDKNGCVVHEPYARTTPLFHAPQGKYDWLNKHIFIGTIAPGPTNPPEFVTIQIFKVL